MNNTPGLKRFSVTTQLSLVAVVVLMGAIFFTINSANQSQDNRSKASATNLLTNPGCESGTSLFKGYQAQILALAVNPHSGTSACRVVSTAGAFYDIESLQSVSNATAGVYTGSAWVRGDIAGKKVFVALRVNGKTNYGTGVTLTTSWQQVTTTVSVPAGATVDYYVVQDPGSVGNLFYVDDMYFQSGNAAIPTTAPVSGSTSTASSSTGGTTFGTTSVGGTADTGDNNSLTCNRYTATATGTVTSLSAYVGATNSSDKTYSLGLYADSGSNPAALLTKSADGQLTANAWNTLTVSAPVTSGAAYWICYNSRGSNDSYNNLKYTSGSTPAIYRDQTYGTWPNPFGTVQSRWTDTYSLYATIGSTTAPTAVPTNIPAATATPIPVPTATPVPTALPGITLAPTAIKTPTPAPTAPLVTATPFPTSAPTPTSIPVATIPVGPTATPVPGATIVKATLLLHGIGNGGDSVNPTGVGNTTPLHAQRPVTVQVYDVQNQLVLSKQGSVQFNSAAGNFIGDIDLGAQFTTGLYTIKIKSDQFLRGLVPGIQTITAGQSTPLPSSTLVTGDVNGDNQINIVDYNMLVGCYSDLLPPVSCPGNNAAMTDITDDGNVNQFDYNLFIRELTNLGGQ